MLQIKNISKQYKTGDLIQNALSDVSLNFRDNEFVSILGPSGSGKTTLLNIIGGLDRYDKGDLIINNVSTKKYKDRDWDSYRNHTIGFVFQSYNLIPHQSILANVELALTISGISRKERRKRAIEALDKVGLKEQRHKKPNQMSGGQMQRVAIARALVNDPDILLADEPTGALDTETSIQVMELLKQVANDRLVIMVTHNPELAEQYSTRIVNLKDGVILGDTKPFNPNIENNEKPKYKNLGKSSMSIATAFSLSLKNLLTKKGRTILTSFAGSIGIIGIALILSLSTGFQNYIDKIQEDALTSYPLTITRETADASAMLLSMTGNKNDDEAEDGTVKESQVIKDMFSKVGTNDVTSLKKYLNENSNKVNEMVSLMQYKYDVEPLIYSKNPEGEIIQLNPSTLMESFGGSSSSIMSPKTSIFNEMIDSKEMLQAQYEIIEGKWASDFNEVMLILPDANSMSDLLAYSLGLRNPDELSDMMSALMKNEKIENENAPLEFTYEELMNIELKLVDATSTYKFNDKYEIYEDMTKDKDFMKNVYENSIDLKIVGIVIPKESSNSSMLSTGIGYTKKLTEYVIDKGTESEIVKKQLEDEDINVFNNKRFDDKSNDSGLDFQDMVSIDTALLSSAFGTNINEKDISNMTQGYMAEISSSISTDTSKAQSAFTNTLSTLTKNMLNDYIDKKGNNNIVTIKLNDVDTIVNEYLGSTESKALLSKLERDYVIPQDTFKAMYAELMGGFLKQYIATMGIGNGNNPNMGNIENMMPGIGGNGALENSGSIGAGFGESAALEGNENAEIESDKNTEVEIPEITKKVDEKIKEKAERGKNTVLENNLNLEVKSDANIITESNVNMIAGKETKLKAYNNLTVNNIQNDLSAVIVRSSVDELVNAFVSQDMLVKTSQTIAAKMTEATMQKTILTKVGELTAKLMQTMSAAFKVDEAKIASAFKFNLGEDEIKRLMETMSSVGATQNAKNNLTLLGYQDLDNPSSISFYFKDFNDKEKFIDFLEEYNKKMEEENEDKVIKYTDITGILMSSVKTIVDSVSYVLIAFVSVSLIVSSIMIGIITYISVLERTKEIGILRAIGASKKNISSIFNAETFIVGLFAGVLGISITLLLLIPINKVISMVTGNNQIEAILPMKAGIILIVLSIVLTLIGGLIPSKHAAKKDPVLALRSE